MRKRNGFGVLRCARRELNQCHRVGGGAYLDRVRSRPGWTRSHSPGEERRDGPTCQAAGECVRRSQPGPHPPPEASRPSSSDTRRVCPAERADTAAPEWLRRISRRTSTRRTQGQVGSTSATRSPLRYAREPSDPQQSPSRAVAREPSELRDPVLFDRRRTGSHQSAPQWASISLRVEYFGRTAGAPLMTAPRHAG